MNKKDYPENWDDISRAVISEANNKCELCDADNGHPHWKTGSIVVLTTHHIDGEKSNNNRMNLIALCQRCHLRLDLERHIRNAQKSRAKKMRLQNLFDKNEFERPLGQWT